MPFVPDKPVSHFVPDAPPAVDAPPAEPSLMDKANKMGQNLGDAVKSSPLYGAADIGGSGALNLMGKIVSGYHGLLKLATGQGLDDAADTVNSDRAAMHTEATSPGAQKVKGALGAVAQPFEAAAAPIDRAVNSLPNGAQTVVHGAEEAIPDVASVLPLGAVARAAKAADAGAVIEGAMKPSEADALGTVQGAGYKTLPSDVQARMGPTPTVGQSVVEGAGGAALRRDIQLQNQGLTQKLAAQDIGIPEKPKLTPADYDAAGVPHGKTYTDTGKVVDMSKPSPGVQQALTDISTDQTPQGMVQPKIRNQINRVQNAMATGNYSGPQAIKDISWFRQNGARDVANAIESEVGDQLAKQGQTGQLAKFQNARTQFAKIQNYQDATTGGVVDAQDFKRLTEKAPHLLTGNAKIIAQAGGELPGLTRLPTAQAPGSALDRVLHASKILTVVPKVAEMVAGKIGNSEAFQGGRGMTPTEQSYVPTYGKKAAPPSQAFELNSPEGQAGRAPQQLGMEIAQGRPAAPNLDLAPPEGNVGVNPTQLGMEIAQGRPLDEQRLTLKPTEGEYEPHQPQLFEDARSPKKAKKRGKD